jgi:hypothetical protein
MPPSAKVQLQATRWLHLLSKVTPCRLLATVAGRTTDWVKVMASQRSMRLGSFVLQPSLIGSFHASPNHRINLRWVISTSEPHSHPVRSIWRIFRTSVVLVNPSATTGGCKVMFKASSPAPGSSTSSCVADASAGWEVGSRSSAGVT